MSISTGSEQAKVAQSAESMGAYRQKLHISAVIERSTGWGENMLRRTLQIVALCCGALGLTIPAEAQFRFSTEALFMSRDNGRNQPILDGPDAFSNENSTDFQHGYRFVFGGTYGDYDVEFVGAQIENWSSGSSGTLVRALAFDETAANPVVFPGGLANTLAFTNSLFDAATDVGIEDNESERLQAGATYIVTGSSQFQDYQINLGSNPTRNHWRFGVGWRQMRLHEGNTVGITGVFDALDTDSGDVAGDLGNEANDALSNGSITGAGYTLRSGLANGYDAVLPGGAGVSPDTLQLYYASGSKNILNGVQVCGGYQFPSESAFDLEVFGRTGIYHNYARGSVGEYLIGSVNDDSIYQRNFSDSRHGVAFAGTLGFKAAVTVTDYITFSAGYEAMYVANVALASAQLGGLSTSTLGDRDYHVRNGDKIIIHGATLGMQVTW
jgi:hypothetical protein